ncbi:hypothetical protein KSP40_PGU019119 [Platanthera guangdongensis]|uniref:Uncharacterized protein n=1 Tax=Platanthera guangdongensis TaxID=2320717 RepID=A0ABR2MVC9_9ASPA
MQKNFDPSLVSNWDSEDDGEVERNYEHYTFDCAVEDLPGLEDDHEVNNNPASFSAEPVDRDLEDEDEVEENYEHYNFHCAEEHPDWDSVEDDEDDQIIENEVHNDLNYVIQSMDLSRENKIEADEAQDDDDLGSSVALLSKCFEKL